MDLKTYCRRGLDWIHLAQNMDQWLPGVNTTLNLRTPQSVGKLLSIWATISFSRRINLHGVSKPVCNWTLAQTVSRWLPTAETWVRSRLGWYEISYGKWHWGKLSSANYQSIDCSTFTCHQCHFHPLSCFYLKKQWLGDGALSPSSGKRPINCKTGV
jgi:hypothetical protein